MDVTITHPTNQSKTAWMDKEKKYEVDGINHQSISSDSEAGRPTPITLATRGPEKAC